jgi:hypothetical protein
LHVVDDGSARLIDLDGAFYAASRTAAEMLQGVLTDGVDLTIDRLAERYALSRERIRTDLETLLADLAKRGLIERSDTPSRRNRLRRRMARIAMAPAFRLLGLVRPSERLTILALLVFARACTAVFGWGPTVAAWRAAIRPRGLLPQPEQEAFIRRIDDAIRRIAAKVPSVDCKERALCCWYVLCSRAIAANLVVGVQLFPMAGHCWCQVGDRVLTDSPRRCAAFVPIVRYAPPADGARRGTQMQAGTARTGRQE